MGQAFVIDNRAGASGLIGTEIVAKAPRDGYTMLAMNCAHTANPSLFRKLPYDSLADFTPVTHINSTWGNILLVNPTVPGGRPRGHRAPRPRRSREGDRHAGGAQRAGEAVAGPRRQLAGGIQRVPAEGYRPLRYHREEDRPSTPINQGECRKAKVLWDASRQ